MKISLNKSFRIFIFRVCLPVILYAQSDTTQKIIYDRRNAPEQEQKPYVIMISADGFRYNYAEEYNAQNLLTLSKSGVSAASMIPSFPSLTFPNHYTLVTGLYPSHHGLVDNTFYSKRRKAMYSLRNKEAVRDGSWYRGTPLWVLAEQQHMLTASFYWVGSEANIKDVYPTYYYNYSEKISIDERINIVVNWLKLPAERRPHFITFYFPEVDHAGHVYGADASQTIKEIHWLDSSVQKLVDAVKKTGIKVNYIFVSDHGMSTIDTLNTARIPADVDTSKFIIGGGGELVQLYAKNSADILPTYTLLKKEEKYFTAYLKTRMPAHFHYSSADDVMAHIGDILLLPTWPHVFSFSNRKPNPGAHGFDPSIVKDMYATFFAWGPAFKTNLKIPSFGNINVYPIVTKILGLTQTDKIDGTVKVANEILK